uniref:Uncharacterized protein n=1 Tax=Desertifilum tharense IPPAS B-1220 TaxID=1781255 RepID=A0ACD5GU69_9CYAN
MKRLPLPCSGFLARSGLLMLVSVAGFAPLGQAQTTPISPTFRSITVSPKFSPDPLVLKGIGGGSVCKRPGWHCGNLYWLLCRLH